MRNFLSTNQKGPLSDSSPVINVVNVLRRSPAVSGGDGAGPAREDRDAGDAGSACEGDARQGAGVADLPQPRARAAEKTPA